MKYSTVIEAIAEANRFIRAARKAKKQTASYAVTECEYEQDAAAIKRASLDLCKLLARMRQGK